MKLLTSLLTTGAMVVAMGSSVVKAESAPFTPEQIKAIGPIISDYLVQNPEVLIKASQALQAKQAETMQKEAKSAILSNVSALMDEKVSVAGNPNGSVTLVEFFDYQCHHCKNMKSVVDELIKKNSDLRVVYREFPIFGKSSEFAAKAALAAAMQGKYVQMQEALFKSDKQLDEAEVKKIAKGLDLNMTKLDADMKSKTVTDAITNTRQLAEKMRLMGTPAFVVLSTPNGVFNPSIDPAFIPGASSEEALQALIKKASAVKVGE